ncbi:MAG: hypothetical protein KAG96_07835 [Ichthyobacteriaceae bacterium]|nr:hypothetical protein [Ichthyobacteriaceae bacterium]
MKKFIKRILILLTPILVVAIIMEVLLQMPLNDFKIKNDYLANHSSEIETLVLGSSHSLYGVNPAYFTSKTYNAAYAAQLIDIDYEIFNKYKDSLTGLKNLIIPISYFTLFNDLKTGNESFRTKDYLLYYNMDVSNSFTDYSEVLSSRFKVNVRRLKSYYINNKPSVICDESGWGTVFDLPHNFDESATIAFNRHTAETFDNFNNNVEMLTSMIEWSEANGVHVVLFTPPGYKTYSSLFQEKQLQLTKSTMLKLVNEYKNCEYFNLLKSTDFVEADYYDADHLNKEGAKKLSKILNDKL